MDQAQFDNLISKLSFECHVDESQTNDTCLSSFHDIILPSPPIMNNNMYWVTKDVQLSP